MQLMNVEEDVELETGWQKNEEAETKNKGNMEKEILEGWIEYYTDKLEEMKNEREKVSELGKYYMDAQIDDMIENIAALKKSYKEMTE